MNKIKIIALCGKAGVGKDTLLHFILDKNPNLHEIISDTTRPAREGEKNGVHYNFLTKEEFSARVLDGRMLEATIFNDWCYGTSLDSLSFDKINIGIFNPDGLEILQEISDIDLQIFYIVASDKTRLLRQLKREENPNIHEIIRRFSTDENDFEAMYERFPNIFKLTNEKAFDLEINANIITGQML